MCISRSIIVFGDLMRILYIYCRAKYSKWLLRNACESIALFTSFFTRGVMADGQKLWFLRADSRVVRWIPTFFLNSYSAVSYEDFVWKDSRLWLASSFVRADFRQLTSLKKILIYPAQVKQPPGQDHWNRVEYQISVVPNLNRTLII